MSITDIKKEIIDKVNSTTDVDLLEDLANILLHHKSDPKPYVLSNDKVSVVNERINNMKNGKRISNEDADNQIDKWLEE